jgi:hypothetical protein
MERALKIIALVVGGVAVTVLLIFGFAIWVFIPLLPAAIIYLVAVSGIKRTTARSAQHSEREHDKAA